ncbi:hypothetical protein Lesp02_31860 [Lentzea sp. NBRC 105346]|nr:thiomuracin/GE37468 family thiazolyl RiPP peptide [Lentzea sp. NBRC 105346]GLZ30997.1 hypothetical protein Lesp02_31860 [Lentzea sp. NBRC 105346]
MNRESLDLNDLDVFDLTDTDGLEIESLTAGHGTELTASSYHKTSCSTSR